MSIKRKMILIGICLVVILVIFTVNVIRRFRSEPDNLHPDTTQRENLITRAEAYRLLSYLEYDKSDREGESFGIVYADSKMSDWYDSYVNAVWKMGLIEGNISVSPKEPLTYLACKELMNGLILKFPELQNVFMNLSFDFLKAEEPMLISEFLELYTAILNLLPEDKKLVDTKELFVLGRDVTEDGKDRIVTNDGMYFYKDAWDYEAFLKDLNLEDEGSLEDGLSLSENGSSSQENSSNSSENGSRSQENSSSTSENGSRSQENSSSTSENRSRSQENSSSTSENSSGSQETNIDSSENSSGSQKKGTNSSENSARALELTVENIHKLYLDKNIEVLYSGREIIYIRSVNTKKVVLHNVWINEGKDKEVNVFIGGIDRVFNAKSPLSSSIQRVVGNITMENQKVVQISVKPDTIRGKVLLTGKDFIEIEGYGKVPLEENYKIYKLYGNISLEPTSSILVGYDTTEFVVSGGKISAALITESIKAENIRVLIKTTDFKSIYHDRLEIGASSDFKLYCDEEEFSYTQEETISLEPGHELLQKGRIKLVPDTEEGKFILHSVERMDGVPKYRGSMEIIETDQGLLIVNELPLEEYLYAVIPSEMPTYYGTEALKVQAVCARSYAYKHLHANSLSEYGAHVDDSVSYQVYNNIAENEQSIFAVKDTYGKVIEYEGNVITAYYFSTSCGHTTEAQYVWPNGSDIPYLKGKLMKVDGDVQDTSSLEAGNIYEDLTKEDNFRSFITDQNFLTYDSEFNWYRWKVTMDVENLTKVINSNIGKRYKANPDLIQTMTSGSKKEKEPVFESLPVDSIGEVVDISVAKREKGGIISELLITGTEKTVKIKTEYNIRLLMAPVYDTMIRHDDSKVSNLSLLPSAFFIIDKNEEEGKLKSITLTGGGYGHGVGMSQNAVKAMVDAGMEYDEIITYFYDGTQIGFIYE